MGTRATPSDGADAEIVQSPAAPSRAGRVWEPAAPEGLGQVRRLQHQIGNRALARLIARQRTLARDVDTSSPAYLAGYNDGLAGNDSAPGPLSPDALDDYEEGYRNGKAASDRAGASLPAVTTPPNATAAPAETTPAAASDSAPATAAATDGSAGGSQPAQTPAPDASLGATGAQSTEDPASFSVGGVPAFRFSLPAIPIATAHVDLPDVSVDLALTMTGRLTITFPNAPPNVSTDVNNQSWRVQATAAIGGLTAGLRVNGIGSDTPSIGATLGTRFSQTEVRFTPPNTMSFIGQAIVGYSVPSPLGDVNVQGQPGFELKVTVTPHPTAGADATEQVVDQDSWFKQNATWLIPLGMVALAVAAVALAPATGGGSLVLLTAG